MEASYDIQSLFGELGGTIGLTLGLCFLSILEIMLFHFVQKWKKISIRITTFLLLIPLAYYVVTSCFKYMNEPISTVVSFTKGNATKEFPYLTFFVQPDPTIFILVLSIMMLKEISCYSIIVNSM